jgi:L-seryl-tRNA(Ser) seleniumtransferase
MKVDPMDGAEQKRDELYRRLPSVQEVLLKPEILHAIEMHGRERVVATLRERFVTIRAEIAAGQLSGEDLQLEIESFARRLSAVLERGPHYSLRPVINATGVILHTNLGRAPLSESALAHMVDVARGYCNLEFDLATGERDQRDVHVERLFLQVLGVRDEDVTRWGVVLVNNCAAATFLTLNTLAEKRDVVVSRGELVEIGGGFRIPEILEKSGAALREVGTTNRTRPADYEQAITAQTALLLRVHQSNFSIQGFVERPALGDLVELAKAMGVPLFEDQGTGLLSSLDGVGVASEPTLRESIVAGVDLVAASGDKLLGGPQCGLLVGRADLIARIRKNPLLRAFRVDKLTYAALEATLFEYQVASQVDLPLMQALRNPAKAIEERCLGIVKAIRSASITTAVIAVQSLVGGGAAPTASLESYALLVQHRQLRANELLSRLRQADPPVIGRIADGAVVLDFRTVPAEMDEMIARTLERL